MTKAFRVWIAGATVLMIAVASASYAAPVDDFHTALGHADKNYRGASFYLSTGNPGLAILELQTLSDQWQALSKRFAANPPNIYASDPEWSATFRQIGMQITAALSHAERDDAEAAEKQLKPIRGTLSNLRRRNGVFLFADCVEQANRAMATLYTHKPPTPDDNEQYRANDMLKNAAVTAHWYEQCFQMAPKKYKESSEFQFLMQSSLRSLALIWEAAHKNQTQRVINILRELRSSDRLLYLRFI